MARTPTRLIPPVLAIVAAAALLLGGIPTAITGAYLTASASTSATTQMDSWCIVPDAANRANVYPLNSFPSVSAQGVTSRMLIVPVVNNGDFAPTETVSGEGGQVGVRLWSCSPTAPTGTVKATAWRGTGTAATVTGYSTSMAQARLSASGTSGLGPELRDLHRGLGATSATDPGTGMNLRTSRYNWILDSTRNSGAAFSSVPACTTKTCVVAPTAAGTAMSGAFSGVDTAPSAFAVQQNSATYLSGGYYPKSGTWPTNAPTPVVYPNILNRVATATAAARSTAYADKTGAVVQWVVLEWTGPASVGNDLSIEVFAR